MTRTEFRANFMAILEKADIINENIAFIEVRAELSTAKRENGMIFDVISVRVQQYKKTTHFFDLHSSFRSDTDQIKDIFVLLDGFIEGIKEVI